MESSLKRDRIQLHEGSKTSKPSEFRRFNPKQSQNDDSKIFLDVNSSQKRNLKGSRKPSKQVQTKNKMPHNRSTDIQADKSPSLLQPKVQENMTKSQYHFSQKNVNLNPRLTCVDNLFSQQNENFKHLHPNYSTLLKSPLQKIFLPKSKVQKRNLSHPHQSQDEIDEQSYNKNKPFTSQKNTHHQHSDMQTAAHTLPFSSDLQAKTLTQFSDFFPTQPPLSMMQSNFQGSYQTQNSERSYQSNQNKFKKLPIEEENPEKTIRNLLLPVENTQEILKENLKSTFSGDFDFYRHSRNLAKIREIRNLFQPSDEKVSVFESLLNQSQKLNFCPRKLNLLNKYQEPNNEIKNSHFRMGDKKANIFSHGIKEFQEYIDQVNVSNNNLSDQGGFQIISALGYRTKKLDLSLNKLYKSSKLHFPENNFDQSITKEPYMTIPQNPKKLQQYANYQKYNQTMYTLSQKILDHHFNLKEINLSSNNLGDLNSQIFLQAISQQGSQSIIQKLDLSKNYLSAKSAQYIKSFLTESQDILELYLGWNNFGKEGSGLIAQGIQANKYILFRLILHIKVLDIKYNNLGQCEESTREWVKVFEKGEELGLIHLDLSFNAFTMEECKIISDGITENHSILGFHFRGNYGDVDSKYFFIPKTQNILEVLQSLRTIKHRLIIYNGKQSKIYKVQIILNCWICEGFEEMTFFWKPFISGQVSTEPILIHFSFDKYEPHLMVKEQNAFKFTKMCPPNEKIYYFFTIQGKQWFSKDKHLKAETLHDPNIIVPYADVNVNLKVPKMNYITSKVIEKNYKPLFDLRPRFWESINYLEPQEEIKIPWTWENSIFKDYRKEDEEFLDKCFEKDLTDSRIEKILKPEEFAQAKTILRTYYKQLKTAYKHYASANPSGEIWSLGQNVYIEFMNNSKLSQNFPQSQISLNFVNTNAGGKKNVGSSTNLDINNNPSNSLIRFQFLEALVRNINDKYVKSNICSNFTDAFKQALDDGLQDELDKIIDETEWRENHYWNENTEIVILKYKNLIERYFKIYAGLKKQQNTKIKFMSFDDFKALCTDTQMNTEGVADRDVNIAYNMAMMGQINEVSSSRHIQMKMIEFWEALARIADSMNPIPHGIPEEERDDWPIDLRMNLEISIKLEKLFITLLKKQDAHFRQENPIPEVSLFNEELIAIKNGKQIAQRARKNVQNKVKLLMKGRRQSQSLKRGGILGVLGALKKSQLAGKLGDNISINTPKSSNQLEDLLQSPKSDFVSDDVDNEDDAIKEDKSEEYMSPALKINMTRQHRKSQFGSLNNQQLEQKESPKYSSDSDN